MFLTLAVLSICAGVQSQGAHEPRPLNIAHRGSSGKLPEHTLEAYRWGVWIRKSYKNVHTLWILSFLKTLTVAAKRVFTRTGILSLVISMETKSIVSQDICLKCYYSRTSIIRTRWDQTK